ncbi:hypothetical protein [Flammeovirga sp. SubArs3]|uniref:hypothetical protein n=1 Tax=Flammeovirga sp. SubArs3 TaxID=2995316 RepID=UPI00248BCD09|nr:hypothetical protein [Flammeovirga sp. SubArs3]
MKQFLLLTTFLFLQHFGFSQVISQFNSTEEPYYLLQHPVVNVLEDNAPISTFDLEYISIYGNELILMDSNKESKEVFPLEYVSDIKFGEEVDVDYKLDNNFHLVVKYIQKENNVSCVISMYDENEELVMRVKSDKLFDSFYYM